MTELITALKTQIRAVVLEVLREEQPGAERYGDAKALCARFGWSQRTLSTRLAEGLPHYTDGGRAKRFDFEEVEEWLKGRGAIKKDWKRKKNHAKNRLLCK